MIENLHFAAKDVTSPKGMLESTVTVLEMHRPPDRSLPSSEIQSLTVIAAEQCTVSFYRYLYETVGAKWLWYDRCSLSDAQLKAIINDPQVTVWVLYVKGVPAGYAELDYRHEGIVELSYFGLIPEFIGKGMGQPFVDWAVQKAWQESPKRVWVHTCNHDHPAALQVYLHAGFIPCHQYTRWSKEPRDKVTLRPK